MIDFPQCAKCCAAMFSAYAGAIGPDETASSVAPSAASGEMTSQQLLHALKDAADLRKGGALDDAEFAALKAKLLK